MIATAALGLGLGLTALHLASVAIAARRLSAPLSDPPKGGPVAQAPGEVPWPAAGIGRPPVTLLRPVCGLDPFDEATLGSSFHLDYPDYEVIFCAAKGDDPAVALVERLIAANPKVPARLLIGAPGRSSNPKLDNLYKGWEAARHGWICMADSNLMLPPDYLTRLCAAWGPRTGLVSCPPIGLAPEGAGGHLEAAFLNGNQARLQFAGDALGQGYAQGKTLFWNRALLDRAGGLDAIGRHLAEDASSTILVRGLGLRVSLPARPFGQPVGQKRVGQVWTRQLRWSRVRRDAFPGLFLAEIANGGALAFVLMMLGLAGTGLPIWLLLPWALLWYGAEWALGRFCGWPSGWRDALALPCRDAMMPALWAATFLRRGFDWRGTAMSGAQAAKTAGQ